MKRLAAREPCRQFAALFCGADSAVLQGSEPPSPGCRIRETEARGDALAVNLSRRRSDVLDALRADGRFVHEGQRRSSRWRLAEEDPPEARGTDNARQNRATPSPRMEMDPLR